MKKFRIIVLLIIMCLCFGFKECSASTKVNTRTEGNYLVPSDVTVTQSNKSAILSTPAIDALEKVYDFAEILSDSEEEKLYKQIEQFITGTSMDFVIVTTSKHTKASSRDYAHDFYDFNDFKNNGMLFLIDMQQSEIYMVTKGSAVSIFTDKRMEPLLKNAYNSVVAKNYYKACSNFITSSAEFVNIGIAADDEVVKIDSDGTVNVSKDLHLLEVFIVALVGTFIIIVVMILSNNMVHKATSSKEFLNRETIRIINISEMYLGSHTSKVSISDSSSRKSRNGGMNHPSRGGGRSGGAGRKF